MKASGTRSNPYLARSSMAIDDDLAVIRELQFENASRLHLIIPVRIGRCMESLQCGFQLRQFSIRQSQEFSFFHATSLL